MFSNVELMQTDGWNWGGYWECLTFQNVVKLGNFYYSAYENYCMSSVDLQDPSSAFTKFGLVDYSFRTERLRYKPGCEV